MVNVPICDAAIKEINKKSLEFEYIALDSDDTPYNPATQSAPINELSGNGAGRTKAESGYDPATGKVTHTIQFVFTGDASVKAICPMNKPTKGQGIGLYRYMPDIGVLPEQFKAGGALFITIETTAHSYSP